jgi:hypothetical protein
MNRIQLACFALLGSAFVLGGILISRLPAGQPAYAEEVVSRENITAMTAQTREDEESLFVIDNASQQLMIYRLDVNRKRFVGPVRLNLSNAQAPGAGGGAGRGNR